jgi:hypothetical protein
MFTRFLIRHIRAIALICGLVLAGVVVWGFWATDQGYKQDAAYKASSPAYARALSYQHSSKISDERSSFWNSVAKLPELTDHERTALAIFAMVGTKASLTDQEAHQISNAIQTAIREGRLVIPTELAKAGI